MKVDGPLTFARLTEIAIFDPLFGEFFSTVQRGRIKQHDVLGTIRDDGYIVIGIDFHQYLAHRLVKFFLNGGVWPQGDVDHRDGNTSCNCPWNLRDANRSQNLANQRKAKDNTSGFKGVAWHKKAGKWRAEISLSGNRQHLGLFERAEDAHAAYMRASTIHYGKFARTT